MHLHNTDVLTYLKAHIDNPGVRTFIEAQQEQIDELNNEFGDDYKDYLDYLEGNIGDDASFTMDELRALLN